MKRCRELGVLSLVMAVVALLSLARRAPDADTSPHRTLRPPLSIRGVRLGMSVSEVSARLPGPAYASVAMDPEGEMAERSFGGEPWGVRVFFDGNNVGRVEGRILEDADGPLFERPVNGPAEVQAVLGVSPRQGRWDDIVLPDGCRLQVLRREYVLFRLSR